MNYIKLINNFWRVAPYLDGYKSDYGILYFSLLDFINTNNWKETEIEYDRIINKTRIGKRMYLEARTWLLDNNLIMLKPGKGDYQKAKFSIISEVQKCTATDTASCTATDTADVPHIYNKPLNIKPINNNNKSDDVAGVPEGEDKKPDFIQREQQELKDQIQQSLLNPKLNKDESIKMLKTDLTSIDQVLRELRKYSIQTDYFCTTKNETYQPTEKFKTWYEELIGDCAVMAENRNDYPRTLGDSKSHIINTLRKKDFAQLKKRLMPATIINHYAHERAFD